MTNATLFEQGYLQAISDVLETIDTMDNFDSATLEELRQRIV